MQGKMKRQGIARWTAALLVVAGVAVLVAEVAAAADEDEEGWSGEVSASLTAQTGTTDSFAGAIDATAERSWTDDVAAIRFSGVYGQTRTRGNASNDEVTQNSQALYADWKHTIHERYFWVSNSELSRDNVQDREVRAALSSGPGYRVWQTDRPKREHFDLSAGIGYRFEMYDGETGPNPDPPPAFGEDGDVDHFADIVASFEYKNLLFEDRIEFTHTGTAKMPANDPEAYILRTEVIAGVPLTEAWSLRIGFLAEYQNIQPDGINNMTTRTTIGLGYQF